MWRAELAWRVPCGRGGGTASSRSAAGSGQAPQGIAKLASERGRSGFSLAATISSPEPGDTHAFEREQIGSELLDEQSDVTA